MQKYGFWPLFLRFYFRLVKLPQKNSTNTGYAGNVQFKVYQGAASLWTPVTGWTHILLSSWALPDIISPVWQDAGLATLLSASLVCVISGWLTGLDVQCLISLEPTGKSQHFLRTKLWCNSLIQKYGCSVNILICLKYLHRISLV